VIRAFLPGADHDVQKRSVAAVDQLAVEPRADARFQAAAAGGRLRALIELTKPGITRLVVLTTAAGFYLASGAAVDWLLFLNTLLGTGLVASAAGAMNQWTEREADSLMLRTRARPLPSGRLQGRQAFLFSWALTVIGFVWLLLTGGLLAAMIVATSLITYIGVYTPLKRRTWYATMIGAVPGALPILAGWAAAGSSIDATGLALFGILFLWQMPHFYALAWIYRDDYLRGGFRMLSADDVSGARTARHALLFALLLLPVSVMPAVQGLAGGVYLAGAVILGVVYAGLGAALLARRTNRRAWRLFFGSVVYLPVLLLLMVLDKTAI
jgi:heme o synthase